MFKRTVSLVAATGLLALLVAACGGGDSTSSAPADTGSEESTSTTAAPSGPEIPQKKIGVIQYSALSPILKKTQEAVNEAAEQIGWEVVNINTELDPQKTAAAPQQLLDQQVDGIIALSVPGESAQAGLKRAQQANVPTCEATGNVGPSSSVYDVAYAEDEVKMGLLLGQYITETIPQARIANLESTIAPAGIMRNEGLLEALEEEPEAEVVASAEPNLAEPLQIQKAVTDILNAHPETNAVYALFDNMAEPAATAVKTARSDAQVFSYYATPSNLTLIKNGGLSAILDLNLSKTGLVCLDQMIAVLAGGASEMSPDALEENGGLKYIIVNKENLSEMTEGGETFPNEEVIQPFIEKWAEEFPAS